MYTVRILQFQSISSGGKCGLEGRAPCSLPLAWIIRHEQCEGLHVGKLETYKNQDSDDFENILFLPNECHWLGGIPGNLT